MKYFKDNDDVPWAYPDDVQEAQIREGLSPITEAEAYALLTPPPAPVPASCTRRQGLRALLVSGFKRADIEAQIAAIEDETEREEAQIDYEASEWERANPRLQQMWALLGGAPEQLDNLFRLAVTL